MARTTTTGAGEVRTSDVLLVRRFADRDPCAAHELFFAYSDPLLRFVLRHSQLGQEDAEDVVNDTFVSALELGHTYDGTCSVFTWLCCLSRYRLVDVLRRAHSRNRVPPECQLSLDDCTKSVARKLLDPHANVEAILDHVEFEQLVDHLLAVLSPDQRDAVVMRYIEGFSTEETARVLRKSPKAVEKLIERARARQRQTMASGAPSTQGRAGDPWRCCFYE